MNKEQVLGIINEWIDDAQITQLQIYGSVVDYNNNDDESVTKELLKNVHSKLNTLKDLRDYIKENLN
ncbi:MAG: hypothetical protein R2685_08005 [Candidatus Nitrosocosmicus sp.]|nr:hypothetical protein [Candidatus Nitrosocosmicus sp.]